MLSVICFRWRPHHGYPSSFSPETVHVLQRMVRRHYPHPHRFICVTDDSRGISSEVDVLPLWDDFGGLHSPVGLHRPSCYRRLRLFDPAMAAVVGARIVWLDLDCVITADLTPLWDRPEDIVLWGGTHQRTPYNGSMLLMTIGARPLVWTAFNPTTSPQLARQAGHYGSDQAWLSYCLGPDEARWTQRDGVYSFRCDVAPRRGLPSDARIIFFHGRLKPWTPDAMQEHPWIGESYR